MSFLDSAVQMVLIQKKKIFVTQCYRLLKGQKFTQAPHIVQTNPKWSHLFVLCLYRFVLLYFLRYWQILHRSVNWRSPSSQIINQMSKWTEMVSFVCAENQDHKQIFLQRKPAQTIRGVLRRFHWGSGANFHIRWRHWILGFTRSWFLCRSVSLNKPITDPIMWGAIFKSLSCCGICLWVYVS